MTATNEAPKGITRAARNRRIALGVIGLLCMAAGTTVLIVGLGLLGADWATRPIFESSALGAVRAHPGLARAVAVPSAVVISMLGLLCAARAARSDRQPNVLLDPSPDHRLEISASAIADALVADAKTTTGVKRARARVVHRGTDPTLLLNLWLESGADVRGVYHDLHNGVLARARDSLGIESLPTAISIEFDAAASA